MNAIRIGATKRMITFASLDRSADPDLYALECVGDCLEPRMSSGDLAVASPSAPLEAGEIVILTFKTGGRSAKVLVGKPFCRPHELARDSELVPLVTVEMLNPRKQLFVPLDELEAIHAVVHVLKPSEVVEVGADRSQARRKGTARGKKDRAPVQKTPGAE